MESKCDCDELRKEMDQLNQKLDKICLALEIEPEEKNVDKEEIGVLSEELKTALIDQLLSIDEINIDMIPDWIERKIYVKIFEILDDKILNLLKKKDKSSDAKN